MPTLNSAPERPPWPEDMEEALLAQQEKLQAIAVEEKRRGPRTSIRILLVRWTVRAVIIGITFWLLCETVIS